MSDDLPPAQLLNLASACAGYDRADVLHDVSFSLTAGTIHCLMGRNGAGKTTVMKTVMGLVPLRSGRIDVGGRDISDMPPHSRPSVGLSFVPQGRRLFTELSVSENLEIGFRAQRHDKNARERALALFPRLKERLSQRAGTLSGGEQQMLATARALCTAPKILLLDEPTEGLQPSMIAAIRDAIEVLRDQGVAILWVEQRIDAALSLADDITFLDSGRTKAHFPAHELTPDHPAIRQYLGV